MLEFYIRIRRFGIYTVAPATTRVPFTLHRKINTEGFKTGIVMKIQIRSNNLAVKGKRKKEVEI